MKKSYKIVISILVIALLIFFVIKLFGGNNVSVVQVETQTVNVGEITTSVTATGTVRPVDTVEVGTQVSGLINKITVTYNSVVKKGELLAELDPQTLQASVVSAQASYSAALNEMSYYKQNYERQKNMYNSGVISKADYEQALYQYNNSKTTVQVNKTALDQAKTNLGYASVYSPIDGVVISQQAQEGQTVTASMETPTLFVLAKDINQMQVEADVDEADIGEVREGLRVSFTVDAFPEETFSGEVKQVRLNATTTSNVVTYSVIISADNPDKKLKPGLTATVTIYTAELANIHTVSAQALNFIPDSVILQNYYEQNKIAANPPDIIKPTGNLKYVWVKSQNGIFEQKAVKTGASDGINTQILEGLSDTDHIVIKMEEVSTKEPNGSSGESQSPFMPKRPSSGSKKSSAN